jgi:hypothetical protein
VNREHDDSAVGTDSRRDESGCGCSSERNGTGSHRSSNIWSNSSTGKSRSRHDPGPSLLERCNAGCWSSTSCPMASTSPASIWRVSCMEVSLSVSFPRRRFCTTRCNLSLRRTRRAICGPEARSRTGSGRVEVSWSSWRERTSQLVANIEHWRLACHCSNVSSCEKHKSRDETTVCAAKTTGKNPRSGPPYWAINVTPQNVQEAKVRQRVSLVMSGGR